MALKCEDICLSEDELEVIYTAVQSAKDKLAWNNSFTRDYEDLGMVLDKIEKLIK
jgi:hypothetical protein